MAKQSRMEGIVALYSNIETAREHLAKKWNSMNATERDDWAKGIGYASDRSLYVAFREPPYSILPGGSCRPDKDNGGNNGDDGNKAPRKPRAKGVLPKEIERWAILSAQADFIRDGNDPDDFVPPEITPDVFLSLRAVKNETPAFVEKAIGRIGGFESDAGKALRQWAGRPLTKEQAEQERAERESAAASTILPKIAKLLSKAQDLAEIAGLEIGGEIAALMAIHGLTVETETEPETE